MLGATLANAVKALGPAPRPDDLNPLNWRSPLDDDMHTPDAALAARVASVVSAWQGRDRQTVADARLLLTTALDVCIRTPDDACAGPRFHLSTFGQSAPESPLVSIIFASNFV